MKILHLPSTFFPRYTGGKEVFTYQLIKNTPQIDHRVVYHSDHDQGDTTYDGISIRVLPPPVTNDYYRSYWELTYDALPGFRETLDEFRPDLVHFHDFCAGASLSREWHQDVSYLSFAREHVHAEGAHSGEQGSLRRRDHRSTMHFMSLPHQRSSRCPCFYFGTP